MLLRRDWRSWRFMSERVAAVIVVVSDRRPRPNPPGPGGIWAVQETGGVEEVAEEGGVPAGRAGLFRVGVPYPVVGGR